MVHKKHLTSDPPPLSFPSFSFPFSINTQREREREKIPPKNFPFRSQFSQHNHEQRIVSPIFLLSKHIFSLSFFSIFNTCVYTHTHTYLQTNHYFFFVFQRLFVQALANRGLLRGKIVSAPQICGESDFVRLSICFFSFFFCCSIFRLNSVIWIIVKKISEPVLGFQVDSSVISAQCLQF